MRTRSPSMIARGITATSGRQLRSCEGRMEIHQPDHAEKQHEAIHGHTPLAREPERPDRERRKGHRQPQTQPGPRQIRIVDGQRGPGDEHGPAQKPASRDQPAESRGHSSEKQAQHVLTWSACCYGLCRPSWHRASVTGRPAPERNSTSARASLGCRAATRARPRRPWDDITIRSALLSIGRLNDRFCGGFGHCDCLALDPLLNVSELPTYADHGQNDCHQPWGEASGKAVEQSYAW